jgi:hypothetical protein
MPFDSSASGGQRLCSRLAANTDLEYEYRHLRSEFERLLAEPVKDYPKIDRFVDHQGAAMHS